MAIPTDNDSKTSTPPPPQSGITLDQDDDEEDMVEMFNEETENGTDLGVWNRRCTEIGRVKGDETFNFKCVYVS